MPDVLATTISSQLINVGLINAITISTNSIYGQFYGDGSHLTGISGGGGSSAVPPFLSKTTLSTNLLTASNISTNSISTNYGFFTTISAGTVYGQFYGDGSQLTGISGGGSSAVPPFLSTNTLSTNLLTASNISTNSISTNNLYVGTNTAQFGNGVNVTGGEIQTQAGTIRIVGSSTLLDLWNYCSITQTSGNLTINSYSNINITSTSNINITSISTNTISTNHVYAYQYHGDGSQLTGISGGGSSAVPPFLSTNTLSTNLLTASNVSTNSLSTNYLTGKQAFISSLQVDSLQIGETSGYIYMPDIQTSTISSVLVYAQFVGDGSRLTGIPAAGGVATTLLNMGENNICNCSSVYADSFYGAFYGNGAYLTSVPGSWVGTAATDLDINGYHISNSTSAPISLQGWGGIEIYDTATGGIATLSVDPSSNIFPNHNIDMAGHTISNSSNIFYLAGVGGVQILDTTTNCNVQVTVNMDTYDMTIQAPTSNLQLNLGGNYGTLSVSGSNLFWNGAQILTA